MCWFFAFVACCIWQVIRIAGYVFEEKLAIANQWPIQSFDLLSVVEWHGLTFYHHVGQLVRAGRYLIPSTMEENGVGQSPRQMAYDWNVWALGHGLRWYQAFTGGPKLQCLTATDLSQTKQVVDDQWVRMPFCKKSVGLCAIAWLQTLNHWKAQRKLDAAALIQIAECMVHATDTSFDEKRPPWFYAWFYSKPWDGKACRWLSWKKNETLKHLDCWKDEAVRKMIRDYAGFLEC